MDDWNDFPGGNTPDSAAQSINHQPPTAPLPPSRNLPSLPDSPSHIDIDNRIDNDSDLGIHHSDSDQAVEEPASRFFQSNFAPPNPPPTPSMSSAGPSFAGNNNRDNNNNDNSRDEDDDDIPEFDESTALRNNACGSSSFYSSTRYHKQSYTKLQVISALQIQQIVHFFHTIIAVALSWTVFSLILCNKSFASDAPALVRPSLLSEKQLKDAFQIPTFRLTPTARYINSIQLNNYESNDPPPYMWWMKGHSYADCFYRANGMYNTALIWKKVSPLNCSALHLHTQNTCYNHWKSLCYSDSDHNGVYLGTAQRQGAPVLPVESMAIYTVRTLVLEKWYITIVYATIIIGGTLLLILATLFIIRLVRTGRVNCSQEQIFAGMLLFFSALYFNIPYAFIQLHYTYKLNAEQVPQWIEYLEYPLKALRDIAIGPFFMFYLWANIHAFRVLDPSEKLTVGFYLPKVAFLAPYTVVKGIAFFKNNIFLSESPFISALVTLHSYRGFRVWHALRTMACYVIAVTSFELAFLAILTFQTLKTIRVLRKAPYMKHRSKQIGFKFFLYLAAAYFAAFYALQILLIVARPIGEVISSETAGALNISILQFHLLGPILLTFAYVVVSAFVNLPYDSLGPFLGWVKGSELAPGSSKWTFTSSEVSSQASDSGSRYGAPSGVSLGSSYNGFDSHGDGIGNGNSSRNGQITSQHTPQPTFIVDKDYELMKEIVEPITYRKRESEDDSLQLKANCFTMQTHVIMFNFAWYVYYYGTPKFENLKPTEIVLPFKFEVAESISEPSTDTHALVIDGWDRIVVAFKGTTSMRNLKTSMKIYHERLVNVVPTNLDNTQDNELHRLRVVFGRSYEAAKIHKGFAVAYASVANRVMNRIKKLIDEKPRPVFLTGHSLGGALATICSLDVWIKLRISRRQVFVSTFGSPRVGNEAFRRIYDSVIALHWRIVVDPDMVAKLPKGMYRHVGKKVLLTPHGQMFIDPSALELKLWSGSTAGLAYHRKASYLLAMRAWCVRNHKKTYTPAFWPFPVRDEDRQRFEGYDSTLDDPADLDGNGEKAKRIVIRDTMVDSLWDENDDGVVGNDLAIEKWARLTRRLLLRSKLSASMASDSKKNVG